MKYTKRFTAAAMAGLIGAMTLVSGVTAYAATGWQQNGSTYYYYDANGELHKGWLNTENGYYYLNLSTGKMTVGWEKINNKWYYFQGNGVMATGWREMDGAWYYFDGSGAMTTGMIEVNGLHYYMDPSTGRMAAGQTLEIGGAVYEAAAGGHLIPQGKAVPQTRRARPTVQERLPAAPAHPLTPLLSRQTEAETALPPKTFQSPQLLLQESTAAPVSALLPPRGR